MRWGVEQRLEFIEFRLFWEGSINRADLVEFFGVSVPQASKDLTLYQERAPGNTEYDNRSKRYIAADKFVLRFINPDPYVYLGQLRAVAEGSAAPHESWIARLPQADAALTPRRDIDIEVLRRILDAVRSKGSVEVLYQSMNRQRPDPIWRRITPHAFGYDGFRWHARAYCHMEHKFKDFLLPRILDIRSKGKPGANAESDWLWNNYFDVIIGPHPDLTESQKIVVAKDYCMDDGTAVLPVRYAMLFYVLKRLGLLSNPEKEDPRRQHIVAINKAEVLIALEKSNMSQEVSRNIPAPAGGE
ncbi:WYL domain-containing protein [Sabulicella glaciei]|uniref:WYL domain-containing protein n=1 Tax=Sabulicella glaciei TaxID=2984948 RepID=A0ABT3NZV7_9PROT|nr:WYL domain-containing protein [Roseococcus sp. MDT2-1-1]MCW8087709.1 WYL domain-containing protein [Roseococcus sp. MDT2-1-1]